MKKLFALFLTLLLLTYCVGTVLPTTTQSPPAITQPTASPTLTVHFIDLGQADCILLECDGEYILIDGVNRDDRREGYKFQALYAYRLRFDFAENGGTALDYLRGKEIKIDPRSIWFVSEF